MSEITHKLVFIQDDDHRAEITVQRSSGLVGMVRSLLAFRGMQANEAEGEPTDDDLRAIARQTLRRATYPDLVAPVVESQGVILDVIGRDIDFGTNPLPFEDFLRIPDELMSQWQEAVYAVNPHWNPFGNLVAEAEKKIEKSTGD